MLRYLESAWQEWPAAGTGRGSIIRDTLLHGRRPPGGHAARARRWVLLLQQRRHRRGVAGGTGRGAGSACWVSTTTTYDRADVAYASLHADPARMYPYFERTDGPIVVSLGLDTRPASAVRDRHRCGAR